MGALQKNDVVLFKEGVRVLRDVKAGFCRGDGWSCNDDAERWGYAVGGVILDFRHAFHSIRRIISCRL